MGKCSWLGIHINRGTITYSGIFIQDWTSIDCLNNSMTPTSDMAKGPWEEQLLRNIDRLLSFN